MQNRTFASCKAKTNQCSLEFISCPDSELDDFRALDICPFPWPESLEVEERKRQ